MLAHGLQGELEQPQWPPLQLGEVDWLLRRYPQAGGADGVLSFSPRPFSSGSMVATPRGTVFVKRHAAAVRDREGLMEEHRLMAHLAAKGADDSRELVMPALADEDGETVTATAEWTYEVHPVARGVDAYGDALSWTPFRHAGHARAAGRAIARLHHAAADYDAPRRAARPLVSSFDIFAGEPGKSVEEGIPGRQRGFATPVDRMEAYLESRPGLRGYVEARAWRADFEQLLLPFYAGLEPWLMHLRPLWTHNDLHGSNLMWSGPGEDARVTAVIDFGLADRTNAVHDIATAIERSVIEWLRMAEPQRGERNEIGIVHFDDLDALLLGYEEQRELSYAERFALVAMLPLVHCEFALSEADYFLTVLNDEGKAALAYEGYFLAHARWFLSAQGRQLLEHLRRWAAGDGKVAP